MINISSCKMGADPETYLKTRDADLPKTFLINKEATVTPLSATSFGVAAA
jgi:hypothetical protein